MFCLANLIRNCSQTSCANRKSQSSRCSWISHASQASATSTRVRSCGTHESIRVRRADRLTAGDWRRLHNAIVNAIRRAVECCSNPPPDFRDTEWWFTDSTRFFACISAKASLAAAAEVQSGGFSKTGVPLISARIAKFEEKQLNPTPVKKPEPPAKKPEFERSLDAPGRNRQQLENANLSLDDAMKLFEEGVSLSRDCQKQLEQAEGRVEILMKKAGGEMAAQPFEPKTRRKNPKSGKTSAPALCQHHPQLDTRHFSKKTSC